MMIDLHMLAKLESEQGLKRRLKAAVPESLVLESFMGPEALAGVFSKTLLNFHPATYDAFGMTIVEAASQVMLFEGLRETRRA